MQMRSGVVAIVGLIIIAFTTAIYFLLDVGNHAGFHTAFVYLWISQVVAFGGIAIAGSIKGKTFARAGISAVLMAYFIATVIATPITGLLATVHMRWLTLIQLLIIAVTLIALVIVGFFTGTADKSRYELPTTNKKSGSPEE